MKFHHFSAEWNIPKTTDNEDGEHQSKSGYKNGGTKHIQKKQKFGESNMGDFAENMMGILDFQMGYINHRF